MNNDGLVLEITRKTTVVLNSIFSVFEVYCVLVTIMLFQLPSFNNKCIDVSMILFHGFI